MFPFILKPVYALVLLGTPSDRAPMFCLSLCPLPMKARPIEEALRLQVQHRPAVPKGFFFSGWRPQLVICIWLHMVSIASQDTRSAKGNPARCDSVKENKHLNLPEALAWKHIEQVHIIGPFITFRRMGFIANSGTF